MSMDLKQLRHFVALAEQGSFSRASEAVAISQPALTRSIKLLEERLGVSLFDRSTRYVKMTDAGRALYSRAHLVLNEAKAAEQAAKAVSVRMRPVRLGLAPMFATRLLPDAITLFHSLYPDVEIEVTSGLFENLSDGLLQGELDLAFSNLPYTRLDPALSDEPLVEIDVCYLASSAHPLAGKSAIPFSEVINYPWAVIDETHANDLYGYIFSTRGQSNSSIRLRTNSLSLLKTLVQSPPWVSLLPRHMLYSEIEGGKVIELNVAGEPVRRPGGLVFRKSRLVDDHVSALAEAIRNVCLQSDQNGRPG